MLPLQHDFINSGVSIQTLDELRNYKGIFFHGVKPEGLPTVPLPTKDVWWENWESSSFPERSVCKTSSI